MNFDVHDIPSVPGGGVVLCHDLTGITCSTEMNSFKWGLGLIENWLSRPGNEEEFILVVMEESLAHVDSTVEQGNFATAVEAITSTLGEILYTPKFAYPGVPRNGCTVFDIGDATKTKEEMLKNGKQVMLAVTAQADATCNDPEWSDWQSLVWKLDVTAHRQDIAPSVPVPTSSTLQTDKWTFLYEDRWLQKVHQ